MPFDKKRNLLILLIFTGLLMILLAVSLPDLQMRLGENLYAYQEVNDSGVSESPELDPARWEMFMRIFSTVMQVLLVIYIVGSLFTKDGRRRLFSTAGVFIILFLMMMLFSNVMKPFDMPEEESISLVDEGEFREIEVTEGTPVEFEPEPRSWLMTVFIVIGAVVLAVGVFFLINRFSRPKFEGVTQFDEFADKAQSALDEIENAEVEISDVIIRYYAEMSEVLQEQSGIQRAKAMTSFEFEQELIKKGFPAKPVQQLTRLFEQVRYGHQQAGEIEKQIAVESLSEIIEFCRVYV